jgi:hypothetical protein
VSIIIDTQDDRAPRFIGPVIRFNSQCTASIDGC